MTKCTATPECDNGWVNYQAPMKAKGVIGSTQPCQGCNADGKKPHPLDNIKLTVTVDGEPVALPAEPQDWIDDVITESLFEYLPDIPDDINDAILSGATDAAKAIYAKIGIPEHHPDCVKEIEAAFERGRAQGRKEALVLELGND
jgi:hypothetical protein